jgi:hypothetical protein
MTKDKFLDTQYVLSVTAGVNQRYHQRRAWLWVTCDRSCKILVGILAVASVCLSVAAAAYRGWDTASIIVASLAAVAAIVLNVLPLGDWASLHAALFQRWTDLREEADDLLYRVHDAPTANDIERLRELQARCTRICGTEPHCKDDKLRELQELEEKSRLPAPKAVYAN